MSEEGEGPVTDRRADKVRKPGVLINDTSPKTHLGCRIVTSRILELARANGIDIQVSSSVHTDWREHAALQEAMKEASIVIVNGEGTLHHNSKQAHALSEVAPFCQRHNVPCALINTTYEDNGPDIIRNLMLFDLVFVRESGSRDRLAQYGIHSWVAPDLIFTADVIRPHSQTRHRVLLMGSADKKVETEIMSLWPNLNDAGVIDLEVTDRLDSPFDRLIYSARGARRSRRLRSVETRLHWRSFLQRLIQLNNNNSAGRSLKMSEIIKEISSARLLLTGRFHGACLAMLMRTPFLAFPSNTAKTQLMLNDAGIAHLFLQNPRDVGRIDSGAFFFTSEEMSSISNYIDRAAIEAKRMFEKISSIAR